MENIKSFKSFLTEMPIITKALTKDKIKIEVPPKGSKKLTSVGSYNIVKHTPGPDGYGGYSFVHKDNKEIHFQIRGLHLGNNRFSITKVKKHNKFEHSGTEAYKELTKHVNLVSDEHMSPGAERIYRNLAADKEVSIHTFDKQKEKIRPETIDKYFDSSKRFIVSRNT